MGFKLYLVVFFLLDINIWSALNIEKPIEVKTSDESKKCTLKLNACELKMDSRFPTPASCPAKPCVGAKGETGNRGLPGLQGMPGTKGDRGDRGSKGEMGFFGLPGIPGPVGEHGEPGRPGAKGEKGESGPEGPPGKDAIGFPGERGLTGLYGPKGDRGYPGTTGAKGDRGIIGPSGQPGLEGVCYQTCPERYNSAEEVEAPEGLEIFGTIDRPSDAPCNVIRNDEKFKGDIWVNPINKFKVHCKEESGMTCLIIKPENALYIEEHAFFSPETQHTPFWLSNYHSNATKMERFNLTNFYNKVTPKQIAWLQSNTKMVTQKIRYHCKNSYIIDSPETALHLFSWNELPIGPYPTDATPMFYTVPEETHGCKEGAPRTEWRLSDILIRGSTKRLPIIDFHIRDVWKEDQSIYIELQELCFS